MNKSKVVVVALAAAILASGGGLAGSVVTATPAQAATQTEAQSATITPYPPYGLQVKNIELYPTPFFNPNIMVNWFAPLGVSGTVTGYTTTLKQEGKPDRIFTSKTTSVSIGGLTENASYTILVKANVTSKTGVKVTTPSASLTMKAENPSTPLKVSAPKVTISKTDWNKTTLTAVNPTPSSTVGRVRDYQVLVKEGTKLVEKFYIQDSSNYKGTEPISTELENLKPNTAYTVEVRANVMNLNFTRFLDSKPTIVKFVTLKSPVVKVAKPVVAISNVASKSAKVTWKKPAVTGEIRTYLLFATEKGAKQSMRLGEYSPASTSAQLPSILKPNTTYTVSVIAVAVAQDGKNTAQATTNVDFTTKR